MIRFEQDPKAAIEEIIRSFVRPENSHGVLYGVESATDAIMLYIDQLKYEIELLKAKQVKDSWAGQVDRQGGSFSDDEIRNSNTWR